MKVDEALRLPDANTLEDTVTVADAQYHKAPWSTRVTFKPLPDDTFMPAEECPEKLLEFPRKPYGPSGGAGHGSR